MVQSYKGARKTLGKPKDGGDVSSMREARSRSWHKPRSRGTRWYYCKGCDDQLDEYEAYFYNGTYGPFCEGCIIEREGEFNGVEWVAAHDCIY